MFLWRLVIKGDGAPVCVCEDEMLQKSEAKFQHSSTYYISIEAVNTNRPGGHQQTIYVCRNTSPLSHTAQLWACEALMMRLPFIICFCWSCCWNFPPVEQLLGDFPSLGSNMNTWNLLWFQLWQEKKQSWGVVQAGKSLFSEWVHLLSGRLMNLTWVCCLSLQGSFNISCLHYIML